MIGLLPTTLEVDGVEHRINSDFRVALLIFEAYGDPELSPVNKQLAMLEMLYIDGIPANTDEAQRQAVWFLDIGIDSKFKKKDDVRTMDYAQDEQLLFSAVNAVATKDVRAEEYLHWWTFYGLCQAISPESLIAHISNIRQKRGKGEKLEKHEQKFYAENRHLIDFRTSDDDYDAMVRKLRG